MTRSSIENELDTHGVLVYTNTGDSMYPLIRAKGDVLVIKKCDGKIKKYDIPLYKRSNGRYVLHRAVGIKKDGSYLMRGDNRRVSEKGITDENILGVLETVVHNGKEIKMTEKRCRLYSLLWCKLFIFRYPILLFRDALGRIKRNFIKKTTKE